MASVAESSRHTSESARPALTTRPLNSLIPNERLPAETKLEGTLVSISQYDVSSRTAALSIVQHGRRVKLLLRGHWSMPAPDFFRSKMNRPVQVVTMGGELVSVVKQERDRNGEPILGGNQLGISFEKGFKGFWKDESRGGKKEEFAFKDPKRSAVVELSSPAEAPKYRPRHSLPTGAVANPALSERTNQSSRSSVPNESIANLYRGLGVPVPNPAPDASQGAPVEMPMAATASRDEMEPMVYPPLADLMTWKSQRGVNAIGIATVKWPPRAPERGFDWSTYLMLYDPTEIDSGRELRFYGAEANMPRIKDGDVFLVRQLNWRSDLKCLQQFGNRRPEFVVLPAEDLLAGNTLTQFNASARGTAQLTEAELEYARDLARWSRRNGLLENVIPKGEAGAAADGGARAIDAKGVSAALAKGGRRGRPTVLIQDIVPDQFCDIYGEIVRYWNPHPTRQIGSHDPCSLFVTDWTEHPQLIDYGDDSKGGVRGQRVLQISVFGAQNGTLMSIPEDKLQGRIVHLRNIRPKLNSAELLEATMVEDFKYPSKQDITLVGSKTMLGPALRTWMTGHNARRKAYWSGAAEESGLAPVFQGDGRPADGHPLTAAGAQPEPKPVVDPLSEISDVSGLPDVQSIAAALALNSAGTYRCRVRVIDYHPARIEEWLVATCPVCHDRMSDSEISCWIHKQVQYDWLFALALSDEEDPAAQVQVIVAEPAEAASGIIAAQSRDVLGQIRAGDSSALRRLTDDLLRGILGSVPEAKRHKKTLTFGHAGPGWEAVLEAYREGEAGPETGKLEWRFAEGKVSFR
ncbi:hypothetical protein JCM8202v2_006188 [Rhodotorula sphaerocarpa]